MHNHFPIMNAKKQERLRLFAVTTFVLPCLWDIYTYFTISLRIEPSLVLIKEKYNFMAVGAFYNQHATSAQNNNHCPGL